MSPCAAAGRREGDRFERITEEMFFVALVLMAFICVFIVFELM